MMRNLFSFLCLLISAGSFAEKTASLHITASYCNRNEHAYFVPDLTILHNGKLLRKTEVSSDNVTVIDKLDTGIYVISYQSIFGRTVEKSVFVASHKKIRVELCLDYFDPLQENTQTFIETLKEEESYAVRFSSVGCFHHVVDSFTVHRTNGLYEIVYKGERTKLSAYDVEKIKVFELEMYCMKDGGCTTLDLYEITYGDRQQQFMDGSCHWRGFSELMADLFLE